MLVADDPDPRGVLPLEAVHVPRSLARTIRKGAYEIRLDSDFRAVIEACAARDSTWINAEIVRLYVELHEAGHAHSVEAWDEMGLAGGLYGVRLGAAFFGESMFSRTEDASKVALAWLVASLRAVGADETVTGQYRAGASASGPVKSYAEELGAGDSIQFDAIQQHTYEALADSEFVILHLRKDKRY